MKFSLWHTMRWGPTGSTQKEHLSLNFKLRAWKLYFKWSPLHSLMTIQYSLIINNRHSWVHNFHYSKLLNNCCSHSFTICHLTVFVRSPDFFSPTRSSAQFSINFFPELFFFRSKLIIFVWRSEWPANWAYKRASNTIRENKWYTHAQNLSLFSV